VASTRQQDKRSIVRRRTQQLVYLELGRENGGVMLNLSQEGCSFQAISPVKCGETRFAFQVSGGRRIAGDAEVMWVDDTGVVGGLRFLNLPQETQQQICLWLEETKAPEEFGTAYEPAAAARLDAVNRSLHAAANGESKASRPGARVVTEEEIPLTPWNPPRPATYPPVDPRFQPGFLRHDVQLGVPHQPRSVGLWRGIAVLTTIAALGALTIAYQREVGSYLISLGETLSGKAKASAVPLDSNPSVNSATSNSPVDAAATSATPSAGNAPSNTNPDPSDTGEKKAPETAGLGGVPSGTRPDTANSKSSGGRQESVLEREVVTEHPGAWDPNESVESLWAAVQSGSVAAEMSLAERFARGEGVIKNCDQAKVLMRAAANRGSREARLRLYEMETQGCH
jgi:PilZ domain